MQLIGFWLEYALVRLLETLLRGVSWETASDLGAAGAGASRLLLRRRWRMTVDNVARAFPDKPAAEHERIALAAWRNTGRTFTELVKKHHMDSAQVKARVRFENFDLLDRMLAEGKGVIMNSAHVGNWELPGPALSAHGYPLAAIGRTMKNPFVDRWLTANRTRTGLTVLVHRNPFFSSVKWLKNGGLLGILIDHNIRAGGIFVPFFERPAATSTLSALLAVRLGSPILTVCVRRDGYGQRVELRGPIRTVPGADPEREVERLTREMTRAVEAMVRERPEEWLWGHNRWRRTPEPAEAAHVA